MSFKLFASSAFLFVVGVATSAPGQSSVNPDISVIGDLRGFWNNSQADPMRNQFNLELAEVELAFQGYLNPYARGDAYVAFHDDGGAEIEEVYLTFTRGLPLGLSIRAGQYLLDFGRLNALHPHAYSFITNPLSNQEYFGYDGLRDVGVHASLPIPTGAIATTLSVDVLKGDFLGPHAHHEESTEEEDLPNERGFAGRLTSFITINEFSSLAIGGSAVTGIPEAGTRRWIWGGDCKYRWKPDRYRSITILTEYTGNRQPVEPHVEPARTQSGLVHDGDEHEYLTRHGVFGYVDVQFRQRYNVGVMGDWVQAAEDDTQESWRFGGFIGFAPVEETSLLRLQVARNDGGDALKSYWSGVVQLVFSLGPHKPHAF